MVSKSVDALIEGGKAKPAPPLGPALSQLGVNMGKVIADINAKTKEYEGMKVPVKITVDLETKEHSIEVGMPPTSALILKELGKDKGSGKAKEEKIGDLSLDKIVKIAEKKKPSLLSKTKTNAVKEILSTCITMGVTVNGKNPKEVQKEIDKGEHKEELKENAQATPAL